MVLKESKTHVSLAFTKHKPSTNQPAVYCHAPLCSAPMAVQGRSLHHPYLRGTVNMQHGNTKLDGGSRSHLYQGSLLQQPDLLTVAPVFSSGSLDMLKRSPSPSRHVKRCAHRPQEKKPSTLTYSWLEDKPGKMTARKLHPPSNRSLTTSGQDPHNELPAGSWSPLFECSAQVRSFGRPGTSQLFFTWPFSFSRIRENTAVLSIQKGKMIKSVKRYSKRAILS